jgi:hypothetical protein
MRTDADSPDLMIAKLLLDHLKSTASSFGGPPQARMLRWWIIEWTKTGWLPVHRAMPEG